MFGFQDICKRWLLLLVEFKLNFIYIYTSMAVYVTCQYTIIIYLLFISISWWLVTKMCNEWVDIIVLNLSLESSFRSAEYANWKQPLDDWNQSYRIYISIYKYIYIYKLHNNINIVLSSYYNFNHYNFFCQKLFLILFLY